jgi:hypothetical protein
MYEHWLANGQYKSTDHMATVDDGRSVVSRSSSLFAHTAAISIPNTTGPVPAPSPHQGLNVSNNNLIFATHPSTVKAVITT